MAEFFHQTSLPTLTLMAFDYEPISKPVVTPVHLEARASNWPEAGAPALSFRGRSCWKGHFSRDKMGHRSLRSQKELHIETSCSFARLHSSISFPKGFASGRGRCSPVKPYLHVRACWLRAASRSREHPCDSRDQSYPRACTGCVRLCCRLNGRLICAQIDSEKTPIRQRVANVRVNERHENLRKEDTAVYN